MFSELKIILRVKKAQRIVLQSYTHSLLAFTPGYWKENGVFLLLFIVTSEKAWITIGIMTCFFVWAFLCFLANPGRRLPLLNFILYWNNDIFFQLAIKVEQTEIFGERIHGNNSWQILAEKSLLNKSRVVVHVIGIDFLLRQLKEIFIYLPEEGGGL